MSSRALFDKAVEVVLEHEGGFVDHPADAGGPTNFGISSRHNPDVDVRTLTREGAIEIYWSSYWLGRNYDWLPDAIAIKVFDLAVNVGHRGAVSCLQRALLATGTEVVVDGLIGRFTAAAAHAVCGTVLLAAVRSEAAGDYRVRLARDESQAPFAEGWLRRAYS